MPTLALPEFVARRRAEAPGRCAVALSRGNHAPGATADARQRTRAGRLPFAAVAVLLGVAVFVFAPATRVAGGVEGGTAGLSVTATVQAAIQLVFVDAVGASEATVGYCPVASSGTANIGLDFGTCSRTTGCTRTCVRFTKVGGNLFRAESAFDLIVSKANAVSASYQVQAWLGSAAPVDATYYINGMQLTTAAQMVTGQGANAYTTRISQDLMIEIRNTLPAQTVNQTIHYLATSN